MALTNDDPGSLAPPTMIGPFRVLHQVGAGVLGPVFRAHDGSGTEVAVKLFRLDLTPEQAASLASALDTLSGRLPAHPGIVRSVAAGLVGSSAWMAEEYVGADGLDARIRRRTGGGLKQILPVIAQVAEALDTASEAGIHHGTLHPRDILLSTTGDVHITGFGVAEALQSVGGPPVVRRPYAAPEQVADPRHRPDATADLFALGAIVVELLTGRRPLGVGSAAANLVSGVADGVDADRCRAALARALAESPGDRFANATSFVVALGGALDDPSVRPGFTIHRAASLPDRSGEHHDALPEPVPVNPSAVGSSASEESAETASQLEAGAPRDVAAETLDHPELRDGSEVVHLDHFAMEPAPPSESFELPLQSAHEPAPGAGIAEQAVATAAPSGADSTSSSADMSRRPAEDGNLHSEVAEPQELTEFESEKERETDRPAVRNRVVRSKPPDLPSGRRRPAPQVVERTAPAPDRDESLSRPGSLLLDAPQDAGGSTRAGRSALVVPVASLVAGILVGLLAGYLRWGSSVAEHRERAVLATEQRVGDGVGEGTSVIASSPASKDVPPVGAAGRRAAVEGTPGARPGSPVESPPAGRATTSPAAAMREGLPKEPLATSGRLVVRSSPPGARVTLNGRSRGVTPVTFDRVGFGAYEVGLSRQGYGSEVRNVTLSADKPVTTLSLTLRKPAPESRQAATTGRAGTAAKGPATVDVLSRPAGAKVYVDGQLVGTTPYHGTNVAPGRRAVRLVLDGYGPWATTVNITAGGKMRVAASLELAPSH